MPVRLKNNARALLVVSISELDPVIRVQVGKGDRFPILGENEWFPLVLEDELGNMEITHAIARAGDVITVRRGQEGTTARPFGAGALASLRLTRQAASSWFSGEDPDPDAGEGDPDYGGTGLIFNGLVVNAYHTEEGRGGYFHPNSGTSEGQYLMAMACYQAVAAIKDYEADLDPDAPSLSITGTLPRYEPGEAYEGRLRINNAIGACEVAQIGGDPLPPGATLRVDEATKEVVIEWPTYAEVPGEPLPNGNFEEGDTGWIKGEGWSIEIAGGDNDGFGARVAVYRAQGFADLVNEYFRECVPGMSVAARVNVQQGASSAGHCGAGIGLKFYDEDKEEIGERLGNQIWSGSKGRWHWSSITTRVPAGAAYMRAFVRGGRKRGYKPLWVDDASWDVPDVIGTNGTDQYVITLQVKDSASQSATWTGRIRPEETPLWVFGPTTETGEVNGTSGNYFIATTDPENWSVTPTPAPSWIGSIGRISSANSALFMHPGSPDMFDGAVSFDGGETFEQCNIGLPNSHDVAYNGRYYFCGKYRSADGINWEVIPGIGSLDVQGTIARQSDGAVIVLQAVGSRKFAYSFDDGETFTILDWSLSWLAPIMATDGHRVWLCANSNEGRYTDDLGQNLHLLAGPSLYTPYWSDDVLLFKGYGGELYRSVDYSNIVLVGTFSLGNTQETTLASYGDIWVMAEKGSAATGQKIRISTDRGETFSDPVAVLGGNGGYICCVNRDYP